MEGTSGGGVSASSRPARSHVRVRLCDVFFVLPVHNSVGRGLCGLAILSPLEKAVVDDINSRGIGGRENHVYQSPLEVLLLRGIFFFFARRHTGGVTRDTRQATKSLTSIPLLPSSPPALPPSLPSHLPRHAPRTTSRTPSLHRRSMIGVQHDSKKSTAPIYGKGRCKQQPQLEIALRLVSKCFKMSQPNIEEKTFAFIST